MRQVAMVGLIGWAVVAMLGGVGCSQTTGTSCTQIRVQTLCHAGLDECREVELTYDRLWDRESGKPQREYELLRVVVKPRQRLSFEQAVKKVELKLGVPRGQCRFENVEARRDETGQRLWFLQRDTSRIIATVDLNTHVTTGPDDEPPAWATPDGGVPLEATVE